MVEFDVQGRTGQDAIDYSWELGERASKECTALFKKPNDLELEKIYCPFFLYSKKRYAAKLYEKNKSGDVVFKYVDIKGLQLVRRDNTPHVREVLRELLDVILESSDPAPPIDLARQRAQELLTGDVPHEKLVLSQSLSDTYKVKGERVSITAYDSRANNGIGRYLSEDINMAHVQVMHKMRERKPGSEPQSGDRVPYLLTVVENNRAAKAFEKSEDPAWVAEHGIPVDYVYYFTQKFLKPICDLLEPLVENPKEEIFGELMSLHKPSRKKKDVAPTQKLTMLDFFKRA
jgi:DNA polymerase delta subunit 1